MEAAVVIAYLVGYAIYVAFVTYVTIDDPRDKWFGLWLSIGTGIIWFILVPFLLIGFFADFE